MNSNSFDLIYEEWKANLRSKDKSAGSVSSNFEELFEELKKAGITFDEAHDILSKAIKAHQPPLALAKNTYKACKSNPKIGCYSEKEFIDRWNDDIASKATEAFFSLYPREKIKDPEDSEPKVYGNMSAKEYKAQRKYADQYPILNTAALEKKMLSESYNPLEDIKNILGDEDSNGNS